MSNTIENLDRLHILKSMREANEKTLQESIDKVYTQRIRDKVEALRTTFAENNSVIDAEISELENSIRQDVIDEGATIKGSNLMAVYNKGRITWDTKGLDGFMVAHPEIEVFRSVGDPSVTIRKR